VARITISLAESAVRDLEDLMNWYKDQDAVDIGRKIVANVIDRIQVLQDQPDIGRIVPEFGTSNLRELIEAPFRIVYRREKTKVQIVRVWRGERQLLLPRSAID
jgi:plasmid stabilization system protein ParE